MGVGVTARLCRGWCGEVETPDGPFSWNPSQVAVRPPAPAPVVVPDLRLLPAAAAQRRLAALGLRARLAGAGPRVLSQGDSPTSFRDPAASRPNAPNRPGSPRLAREGDR